MAIKIRKKKEVEEEEVQLEESEELAEPDSFVRASVGFSKWVEARWRTLVGAAALLIVAVIALTLYLDYRKNQQIAQSSELNKALAAYNTPTSSEVEEQRLILQLRYPNIDPAVLAYRNMFDSEQARAQAVYQAANQAAEAYGDSDISGEAHLVAASAAVRLGNANEAQQHVDKALSKVDDKIAVFALQAKAAVLTDKGNVEDAIATYKQVYEKSPKFYGSFALMQMGTLQLQAGNRDAATDAFAELAARYPEDPQVGEAKRQLGLLVDDPDARIAAVPLD